MYKTYRCLDCGKEDVLRPIVDNCRRCKNCRSTNLWRMECLR